jgi:hypothetical protein
MVLATANLVGVTTSLRGEVSEYNHFWLSATSVSAV